MWSAHFTSVSLPFTSRRRRERDTEWRALPVPFPSLSSFIRLVARFSPLATLPPAPSTHRRRRPKGPRKDDEEPRARRWWGGTEDVRHRRSSGSFVSLSERLALTSSVPLAVRFVTSSAPHVTSSPPHLRLGGLRPERIRR